MNEILHYDDRASFGKAIEPLENLYSSLTDEQRDIYYESLFEYDRDVLRKAVAVLIEEHGYKRFPFIKEIKAAIKKVNEDIGKDKTKDFERLKQEADCPNCNSTGYVLFEKKHEDTEATYTTERYCGCPIGAHLQATVKWDK